MATKKAGFDMDQVMKDIQGMVGPVFDKAKPHMKKLLDLIKAQCACPVSKSSGKKPSKKQ